MKKCNPLISVITCTYNSKKFLKQCLDSVSQQTYKNIEHIIVDGYSTDNTLEIIQNYINTNKKYKIILIKSEPKGIANALNIGITKSHGEIIHFVHSDDFYYTNNALQKVVKYFEQNPKINWILGNHVFSIYNKNIILPNTFITDLLGKRFLSFFPWMSHQNMFMKKNIYDKYGLFDEKYKNNLDYDQWLRIINYEPILFIRDNFSVFRVHRKSTTFNPQNFFRWLQEYRHLTSVIR